VISWIFLAIFWLAKVAILILTATGNLIELEISCLGDHFGPCATSIRLITNECRIMIIGRYFRAFTSRDVINTHTRCRTRCCQCRLPLLPSSLSRQYPSPHIAVRKSPHIVGRAVNIVNIGAGESLNLGATTFSQESSLLSNTADYLGLELAMATFDNGSGNLVGQGAGSFGVFVSLPHRTETH
jgi:hypothetical protein